VKVINLFPPNWREINAAFNVRGKPVIYCYGDAIYNPQRISVGPDLLAHERVHSLRQGRHPDMWWRRYIADVEFRLQEEIPAHRAELGVSGDLDKIARRLAGPLYGSLITFGRAVDLLERERAPTAF
jgi:hypothetical protein